MRDLPQVTLIAVATQSVEATGRALVHSCQGLSYGAVKLVSPYRPSDLPEYIQWDQIIPFPSIDAWNEYIVYNLWKHFDTDFCLLVHADGCVVNPQSWRQEFLQYDYIGSPWSNECAIAIQAGRDQPLSRVGNSVGIRSRRLCMVPSEINLPWRRFNNDSNEDTFISCHQRTVFELHGCTFAPLELAMEFGREEDIPECQHIEHPFVFHKWQGRNIHYPRF